MENGITYIGKVGLEDLSAFHEAEFEIIDYYYFNSGRNDKTSRVIKNMHDLRLKLKIVKIMHKLLLNC